MRWCSTGLKKYLACWWCRLSWSDCNHRSSSRCNLCAQVCDTNCIGYFDPARGELAGTPHIVAERRACNLCLQCTQVCPTGALFFKGSSVGEMEHDKQLVPFLVAAREKEQWNV